MKWLVLLFLLLSACSDCQVTEATGGLEIFKNEGCFTIDETVDPNVGALMSIVSQGKILVTKKIGMIGVLYVGRRGTCGLSDEGSSVNSLAYCDYVVRGVSKISDKESRYTIEILQAGIPGVYSLKGVFSANSISRGAP